MSQEIDLNTNNLCTTEDAFEQFQAVSMYEENEILTLTEIVPPPPKPQDLSEVVNDIPYEQEVVLESQLEEQVCEVNSTIESISEEIKPSVDRLQVNESPAENREALSSEPCKPKRGRKKKTQDINLKSDVFLPPIENNEPNISSIDSVPNSQLTSPIQIIKKRGRPRKSQTLDSEGKDTISNYNKDNNTSIEPTKRNIRHQSPNTNSINNSPIKESPCKKRGRKSTSSTRHISSDNSDLPVNANKPKKRGRPKKVLPPQNLTEVKPDVVPEIVISKEPSSVNPEPVKMFSADKVKPKKLSTEIKSDDDKIYDVDDEADNISLSKLKQTYISVSDVTNNECGKSDETEDIKNKNPDYFKTEGSDLIKNNDISCTKNDATDNKTEEPEIQEISKEIGNDVECILEDQPKRNSKMPTITDFEYNIVGNEKKDNFINVDETERPEESLLVEDMSKRPSRKRARQAMHYDEESDEDPYANMDSSEDEEPKSSKKYKKYYSDDEYVPGGLKCGNTSSSDVSDIDEGINDLLKQRRKKKCFDPDKSPKKRGRKPKKVKDILECTLSPEVETVPPISGGTEDDDIEICLQSSVIKANEDTTPKKGWEDCNEFKSFIAKKIQGTDIKITKSTTVQPLEIPVIDPNLARKPVEVSTQTTMIKTHSIEVQTIGPHEAPMKENVPLTAEVSEKACEFLKGIVKTTAELGELMTQKSEDFIKKKIKSSHVTDTFKMDYCVRKSFLLFKLAKHNLQQMEEDLSKQYDEFLNSNNLIQYREKPKVLVASTKSQESDSDCEIIEDPVIENPKVEKIKPKFNPKTVFLNKELSIKIAKKPSADKNLKIRDPHTVWINDSVLVKKVKQTQSFLAQDSRNKKPPDYVTIEMVSNFFKDYYRQQAINTCAPFLRFDWLTLKEKLECWYFLTKPDDFPSSHLSTEIPSSSSLLTDTDTIVTEGRNKICEHTSSKLKKRNPQSLFLLSIHILQKHLYLKKTCKNMTESNNQTSNQKYSPHSLHHLCVNSIKLILDKSNSIAQKVECFSNPLPLKTLCLQRINMHQVSSVSRIEQHGSSPHNIAKMCLKRKKYAKPLPLATLCLRTINNTVHKVENDNVVSLKSLCLKIVNNKFLSTPVLEEKNFNCTEQLQQNWQNEDFTMGNVLVESVISMHVVDSLFSLCFRFIQSKFKEAVIYNSTPDHGLAKPITCYIPNTLMDITYRKIFHLIFENRWKMPLTNPNKKINKIKTLSDMCVQVVTKYFSNNEVQCSEDCLTINSVNTLTEEAFLNIEQSNDNLDYYASDDNDFYEGETDFPAYFDEDENAEDNNWISQVQMKELRSCYVSNSLEVEKHANENNLAKGHESMISKIKIEPEDDSDLVDTSIVKTETVTNFDDNMTIIPDSVITKSEIIDHCASEDVHRRDNSYDVESFESFVRSNKIMYSLNQNESLVTHELPRIRRQYEPDSDTENDMGMSLLVPQTYEPMDIQNAKGSLMESSGDESDTNKKNNSTKKKDKRRPKYKKTDPKLDKQEPIKDTLKEKSLIATEVTLLTRRMRDKIRQEEKKVKSSDSENEDVPLATRKTNLSKKSNENITNINKTKSKNKNDNEIQCNNVDSTEQINENSHKSCDSPDLSSEKFPGFSKSDRNDISNYHKYLKFISESLESTTSTDNAQENAIGFDKENLPIIDPQEPIELLECQPTMPIFDEEKNDKSSEIIYLRRNNISLKKIKTLTAENDTKSYIERHGWNCYPVNCNDMKLYQYAQIILEKLPESFVDIYFKFQNITNKNEDDVEVERLTNLQSLNRAAKDGNIRFLGKRNTSQKSDENTVKEYSISTTISACANDSSNELTPSEDEGENGAYDLPLPAQESASENNRAKNDLMDENGSEEDDNELIIKTEPADVHSVVNIPVGNCKPCPKSKKKFQEIIDSKSLMLTADKMMNKELNLLHAPVTINEEKPIAPLKGPLTRNKTKHIQSSKPSTDTKAIKTEEDSSSEEEKQWFTIKEKLLKRMINKKDTTREDDAKRAKLVSEFIERRGEVIENYLQRRQSSRGRRSKKKMLERQKQLKVLTRELFGDAANDPSHQGKSRYNKNSNFKGRRNIRKVIDKKSLAKSTVMANMEEFERKRRLNTRQAKLRELLGCEDGVNVLVINDEVCLEYDFEQRRPVVTIHSFFTKVMKAHQYEGVKFMWDACFESLDMVESGHGGGGCILAHCMGLGKTLQVLALLHTVLTHPRVGMRRVLVCCPLSTVLNWVDEIHKWIGPVTDKIKVFELSKLKKTYERAYQLEDWYNGGGIFIIGYELFRSLTTLDPYLDDVRPTIINKIRTALLDPGPDIIICDEGHLLKNDCSVLSVAMSRVVTKRRIVLTGTPMQNNLREYYCMVNFIKPNLLGTYNEYSNRFENPIMNGQHRDSIEEDTKLMKARTHILHKVLEGCLQRQEASVLYPYLPKKHEYTVFISLTKCQWDLYKHYMQNYANKQSNKSVLKDFHILQKIWSHPQVLHNFQTRALDVTKNKVKLEKLEDDLASEDLNADLNATEDLKPSDREVWWLQYLEGGEMLNSLHSSNKFLAVFRILEECVALGDKLLIFSTSLFTMDSLEYFLKKINNWSLGHDYYRLDGSVPAEVRQKWCREFNAESNLKTKLFLISTRAGSLGLNMTAANRVIILDTSWNPAHDIQSIFRVYRFGQKKACYIYRLVAMGTMEQKIYERSVTKQAVACRVLDEQQIDRHYNMADLTELYRYDESGVSVAGGVAVGVEDVALLRVARDEALHAVHEHDSLLRHSGDQQLPEHERNAAWMQFQQEHATKQMQNELETKKEESKSPIKMLHGHDYAMSSNSKPYVKTEKNKDSPTETTTTTTKSRRNKKNSIVSCCIPIQPETSSCAENSPPTDLNPDHEKVIVQKITNILLQHDFHNRQEPKEISALVANVRKIVETGGTEALAKEDSLSMSIAQVLLQKSLPMPTLTDIVCESVNNSINVATTSTAENTSKDEVSSNPTESCYKSKKRGRKPKRRGWKSKVSRSNSKDGSSTSKENSSTLKEGSFASKDCSSMLQDDGLKKIPKKGKGYVYEEIKPEPSNTPENKETYGRRKRRAALLAERNFDTITSGIVDLDGDDSDKDFVPNRAQLLDVQPVIEPQATEIADNETFDTACDWPDQNNVEVSDSETETEISKKKSKPKKHDLPTQSKAIILSDEEEPLEPKKPGRACKTYPSLKAQTAAKVPEEVPPLHPSLLTNQNFIKIVAHTYLTGNPMLDEDAATLAAQYSTQKALKEFESSGKIIDTGPLHEIAMNILGADVLKKLHAVKPVEAKKPTLKAASNDTTVDKTKDTEPGNTSFLIKEKTVEPVKPVEPQRPIKLTIKIPSQGSSMKPIVTSSSITHVPTPTSIIPVGLFMGPSNLTNGPECTGESILPDDHDVRIVPDTVSIIPDSLPYMGRRNSQQLVLKSITSDSIPKLEKSTNLAASMSVSVKPQLSAIKNIAPKLETISTKKSKEPEQILSDINTTISLDSDEEENTPAPPIQSKTVFLSAKPGTPVPISLTKVNSRVVNANKVVSTQKIILPATELGQYAGNKKIIIVPKRNKLQADVDTVIYKANVPKAVTQNPTVAAIQQQPSTTETMLPTRAQIEPNIKDPEKGCKRLCRPGDILRITKSGAIEVLNRNVEQPSMEQPLTANPACIQPPPSQSDPLSILKDVIHIEAETYGVQLPKNNPIAIVETPTTSKETPVTSNKADINSSTISKKSTGDFMNVLTHKNVTKTTTYAPAKKTVTPHSSIIKTVITPNSSINKTTTTPNSSTKTTVTTANISTKKATTTPNSSTMKTVTTPNISTKKSTTTPYSSTMKTVTTPNISTKKATTTPNSSTMKTVTTPNISTKKATTAPNSSTMKTVTTPNISTKKPTTTPNTSTMKTVITPNISTKKATTTPNSSTIKTVTTSNSSAIKTPTTATGSTPLRSKNKVQLNQQGTVSKFTSVDLTDDDIVEIGNNSNRTRKITGNKVTGTSKEILIRGTSKGISKLPSQSSQTLTFGGSINLADMPIELNVETKKRPAPISTTSSVKKKKTDKPMTLQDFDIDDIDDIIELD